jgi:predicted Rossmann fold flavoprotein
MFVTSDPFPRSCDVVIVGAGAAGLMAAVHARANPRRQVVVLDGASRPGAKILVSGGSRCNVTNTVVSEQDFWGGRSTIVRKILRAYQPRDVVAFFENQRVPLREEEDGKLFPVSNRSRDILEALLRATAERGAMLHASARVTAIEQDGSAFALSTSRGVLTASAVVLATGGLSLPKTGSDGSGYAFAQALGHTIVAPLPALAPLVLDEIDPHAVNGDLSGVSQTVEIAIWIDGSISRRLSGSLLWTHFGVSGPVVLNASRHWGRARLEGRDVRLTVNFRPGRSFDQVEQLWIVGARKRPTVSVRSELARDLPQAVAEALPKALSLDPTQILANLSREDRRRLIHALTAWPLPVKATRGYNYAEVTAGGIPLTEIDPATMESRLCPGLHLIGEILDVDGRIGGFNFQWAWATGKVAGGALSDRSTPAGDER